MRKLLFGMPKLKGVIMNNLEANALRIAELMGHDLSEQCWHYILIESFSHYDYLMPIVFECRMNIDSQYDIEIKDEAVMYGKDVYFYNTEPEFIEGIQECVIKYLELRNKN